ncbi:winged helix DNA-binding protein [Streptomyces niveus]|uniref:winged helix DNA-binding protein n=1 Tax=Streptomyces niveus TaxID=193462 RepID=UPI003652C4D7
MVEVLRLLLAAPVDDPLWAARIGEEADLGKSTVSQILAKLVELEWVVTSQEEKGSHPGRPPRTFYVLTDTGRREAHLALDVRSAKLQVERGGAGKTSMKITPPVFGEASDRDLGELLAHLGAGHALGDYDMVLVDSPGFGGSLPAAPEQIPAVGPDVRKLPRPGQDEGLGRELEVGVGQMPRETRERVATVLQKYELPGEQELAQRMRAASDEPLLEGFRAAVASRLAGRTLPGMGVANAVALVFAEQMDPYDAPVRAVVGVQARLMLEACLESAPERVRSDALDHFAALGPREG